MRYGMVIKRQRDIMAMLMRHAYMAYAGDAAFAADAAMLLLPRFRVCHDAAMPRYAAIAGAMAMAYVTLYAARYDTPLHAIHAMLMPLHEG